MSLILVFEPTETDRDRIESALSAEGWHVELENSGPDRDPDLVLVSTAHARASELARRFSRDQGGPGVLVLTGEGEEYTGPGHVGLEKPFTDQELRASVRRRLAKIQREAAEAAAREAASSGAQLTSAELFGDMLAEVEGREEEREPTGTEPVSAADEPGASPPRAPKSGKARRDDDLDAQIEETLSGVLGSAGETRRRSRERSEKREQAAGRRDRDEEDLDALLDQTLSGLGVGKRRTKKAPTQQPSEASEAEALEPEDAAPSTGPGETASPERPGSELSEEAAEPESFDTPGSTAEESAGSVDVEVEEAAIREPASGEAPTRESAEASPGGEPRPELSSPSPPSPRESSDQFATQRMEAIRPEDLEPPPSEKEPSGEPTEEIGEETFGQYTLLERVAVGGMAEVWKARRQGMEGFQKTVAIKRILPHLTDSSDFVTMFIDEAKLAAQLNHPHIIHIYDLGKIDEDYYIAMEYVEGKDLRSILSTAREEGAVFPPELALLVAGRLAGGLDYAHRKRDFEDRELGLVHRDVSPQNVLISYEGDIKLCDFGIVKAVAKASKTQMGALKGKLQYMSPEQAWGRVVDARSDIFSLGTVLYEMLTGQRLFAGDSELSVLEAVRECRVQSPREVNPEISEETEAIVERALRKDPDDRYQSAGEMQEEIESLLYELKPTPSQGDLGAYVRELFGAEEIPAAEPAAPEVAPSDPHPEEEEEDEGDDVAAMPPLEEIEEEETAGLAVWLGLAAAILVVLGLAVWLFFRSGPAPEGGEAVSAQEIEQVEAPEPQPSSPAPGSEAHEERPVAPPDGAEVGEEQESVSTDEATDSESVDLEALVDAEVEERDAELQRRFEEEKRRLEEEIAAAREEESLEAVPGDSEATAPETVETPPGAAPSEESPEEESRESPAVQTPEVQTPEDSAEPAESARPAREEPDDRSVESEIPTEDVAEPPSAPVASGDETAAGGERVAGESEDEAGAVEPTGPAPPPVTEETEPPEPEAEEPAVRRGELVESGTPGLIPPRLVSIDKPQYPPIARRMKVEGTVVVSVLVDEDGTVQDTRLVQGVSDKTGLDEAAVEAAETATFRPGTVDGVPVKSWFNLRIPFRL